MAASSPAQSASADLPVPARRRARRSRRRGRAAGRAPRAALALRPVHGENLPGHAHQPDRLVGQHRERAATRRGRPSDSTSPCGRAGHGLLAVQLAGVVELLDSSALTSSSVMRSSQSRRQLGRYPGGQPDRGRLTRSGMVFADQDHSSPSARGCARLTGFRVVVASRNPGEVPGDHCGSARPGRFRPRHRSAGRHRACEFDPQVIQVAGGPDGRNSPVRDDDAWPPLGDDDDGQDHAVLGERLMRRVGEQRAGVASTVRNELGGIRNSRGPNVMVCGVAGAVRGRARDGSFSLGT